LSSRIRNHLAWLLLLQCLTFAGCDSNSPDSILAAAPQSAEPQSASGSQSWPPPPPPPPVDIAPSEILSFRLQRPPKYPVKAVRERMEGKVVLKVLVGLEGEPEEISLEKSSGSEDLDRAAITAVKSWMFNAGLKRGYVTRSYLLVPIEFNLSQ
jgi:periplasmic protein TonB